MSETRDQEHADEFDLIAESKNLRCRFCDERITLADRETFNSDRLCSRCARKMAE